MSDAMQFVPQETLGDCIGAGETIDIAAIVEEFATHAIYTVVDMYAQEKKWSLDYKNLQAFDDFDVPFAVRFLLQLPPVKAWLLVHVLLYCMYFWFMYQTHSRQYLYFWFHVSTIFTSISRTS